MAVRPAVVAGLLDDVPLDRALRARGWGWRAARPGRSRRRTACWSSGRCRSGTGCGSPSRRSRAGSARCPAAKRLPAGTVYVPSASGWIRSTLPRRSLVLPEVRWASKSCRPGPLVDRGEAVGLERVGVVAGGQVEVAGAVEDHAAAGVAAGVALGVDLQHDLLAARSIVSPVDGEPGQLVARSRRRSASSTGRPSCWWRSPGRAGCRAGRPRCR